MLPFVESGKGTLSWNIWIRPKHNHKCPYKWEAVDILNEKGIWKQRRNRFEDADLENMRMVGLKTGMIWPQAKEWASLVSQIVKNLPAMEETWVPPLHWEDPMEKGMASHSSILAWKIPWTEKLGRLPSMGGKESDMTEWPALLCLSRNGRTMRSWEKPTPWFESSKTDSYGGPGEQWENTFLLF